MPAETVVEETVDTGPAGGFAGPLPPAVGEELVPDGAEPGEEPVGAGLPAPDGDDPSAHGLDSGGADGVGGTAAGDGGGRGGREELPQTAS